MCGGYHVSLALRKLTNTSFSLRPSSLFSPCRVLIICSLVSLKNGLICRSMPSVVIVLVSGVCCSTVFNKRRAARLFGSRDSANFRLVTI